MRQALAVDGGEQIDQRLLCRKSELADALIERG